MQSPEPFLVFTRKLNDDWDRAPLLQMIQEERLQTEWQKAADFDA